MSPATAAGSPPNGPADGGGAPAGPALPPPVAVPTVRTKQERSIRGQTTASDYVAPRELPVNTPRPAETEAAKVVIHVPDAPPVEEGSNGGGPGDAELAELRKRRRAPTLKIERSAVKELKHLDDARIARAEAVVAALALAQAQAAGSVPASARISGPGQGSLGQGSLAPDTPRQLARPASDHSSPRSAGWLIAIAATIVVGVGALAVGLGWVPGLAPADDTAPPARPTPSAVAPTAQPAATEEPAPSGDAPAETAPVTSAPAPHSAPEASAVPAPSTTVRPPVVVPWQGGKPPARPPPARPRPKSDIPQGI